MSDLRPVRYPVYWYYRYIKEARKIRTSGDLMANWEPDMAWILLDMADILEHKYHFRPTRRDLPIYERNL